MLLLKRLVLVLMMLGMVGLGSVQEANAAVRRPVFRAGVRAAARVAFGYGYRGYDYGYPGYGYGGYGYRPGFGLSAFMHNRRLAKNRLEIARRFRYRAG